MLHLHERFPTEQALVRLQAFAVLGTNSGAIAALTALLLAGPSTAHAQQAGGSVSGLVTLGDGTTPAPMQEVVLTCEGSEQRVFTDLEGRYQIARLPAATCSAQVTGWPKEWTVTVGAGVQTLDMDLPIGEIVVVKAAKTKAQALRESAHAVRVVETKQARRESSDLGEVVARVEGVGVRRPGGLGSRADISIGGMGGARAPIFLDGVPASLAGVGFGLANLPVGRISRVDIYRGVTPIRLGSDALGVAVEMVRERNATGTYANASYQRSSFATHRATAGVFHNHSGGILAVGVEGFYDSAENNYDVDVEVPNELGLNEQVRTPRFHDGYRAQGAEVSLLARPANTEVELRLLGARHSKDVQNNPTMSVPYGEVSFERELLSAQLRMHRVRKRSELQGVVGYSDSFTHFEDVGFCRYNWLGECVFDLPTPGEIGQRSLDRRIHNRSTFARLSGQWALGARYQLGLALAPTYGQRIGEDRVLSEQDVADVLGERQHLFSNVTGVELTSRFSGIESIGFLKHYVLRSRVRRPVVDGIEELGATVHRWSIGQGLRWAASAQVALKASYEWATRLPSGSEMFGDGVFVAENLELGPESSHNANLEVEAETSTPVGGIEGRATLFARWADELITLFGANDALRYDNVFAARVMGADGSLAWQSPSKRFRTVANATYNGFRNRSKEGPYLDYDGDRIPNRPYLFANIMAQVQLEPELSRRDRWLVGWTTRYIHDYFLSWESIGSAQNKLTIPSQLVHGVGTTYTWRPTDLLTMGASAEIHNLSDERIFDFYGVQKPGRAFSMKVFAEY